MQLPNRVFAAVGAAGLLFGLVDATYYGGITWNSVAGLAVAYGALQAWLVTRAVRAWYADVWFEGWAKLCPRCENHHLTHRKVFVGLGTGEKPREKKDQFECHAFCPMCSFESDWETAERVRLEKYVRMTDAIQQMHEEEFDEGHD